MPNASTTARHGEPFHMYAPAGCSCTCVPKTPTTNEPSAPGHQSLSYSNDNNRYFPGSKSASLYTRFFLIFFFIKTFLYSSRAICIFGTRLRRGNLISQKPPASVEARLRHISCNNQMSNICCFDRLKKKNPDSYFIRKIILSLRLRYRITSREVPLKSWLNPRY